MCIVTETNELTSIDDRQIDTSTIQTTMSIHSLLNVESTLGGWNTKRRATIIGLLLPQGASSSKELTQVAYAPLPCRKHHMPPPRRRLL